MQIKSKDGLTFDVVSISGGCVYYVDDGKLQAISISELNDSGDWSIEKAAGASAGPAEPPAPSYDANQQSQTGAQT